MHDLAKRYLDSKGQNEMLLPYLVSFKTTAGHDLTKRYLAINHILRTWFEYADIRLILHSKRCLYSHIWTSFWCLIIKMVNRKPLSVETIVVFILELSKIQQAYKGSRISRHHWMREGAEISASPRGVTQKWGDPGNFSDMFRRSFIP